MMELPQPCPFRREGSKSTHEFLSLYTRSTSPQDPAPSSQGSHLKTHDFLQPLERIGKKCGKEETKVEISTAEEPPPAPLPSVAHLLPGGIGTCSITQISFLNHRVPIKPEGSVFTVAQSSSAERNDKNSNCTSFRGTGFPTSWQESAVKKGKTRKKNVGLERPIERETPTKIGTWTASSDRPSPSSSNNQHSSFSSFSSSQPMRKKKQSFMEMITSARGSSHDEELDDKEEFVIKTEIPIPQKGELRTKVEGKVSGQKPNTPRSKHSATEQRRRSKINDRFQMLREVIPHSDQKRDKASFLQEVIEYIQYLQEKVHKYEGSYQGWNHEPEKLMPWRNNLRTAESSVEQFHDINIASAPALAFAAKFEEKNVPHFKVRGNQIQMDSDTSSATTFNSVENHNATANKAVPLPMSLQRTLFIPVMNGDIAPQVPPPLVSEAENTGQTQNPLCQTRCYTDFNVASEKLKQQELTVEGGKISISSAYSQGLLTTLTQALKSSGVDLSLASISVQIELEKQPTSREIVPTSIIKDADVSSSNLGSTRSRVGAAEDSEQALKKLKTGKT